MFQEIFEKKIVVFGTGYGSKVITEHLAKMRLQPAYFVDNDSTKWNESFCGYAIMSPEFLINHEFSSLIILVASSHYHEIAVQLQSMSLYEGIHFFNGFEMFNEVIEKAVNDKIKEIKNNQEKTLKRNLIFKRIHHNRCCFILGNGPSLATQNLILLKNEIKIVVNFFNQHSQVKEVSPQYWFVADPKFWNSPRETLYPLVDSISSMGLVTNLFLPIEAAECIDNSPKRIAFPNYYYQFDHEMEGIKSIDFSQLIPPFGQNVIIPAIMFAIYMGCSTIYLLGCDHTWWGFSEENYIEQSIQCEKNRYFYSQQGNLGLEAYHEAFTFTFLRKTIEIQKKQYYMIKDYGLKHGCHIYNATNGGFLDIFPRVDYESLFHFN